MKILLIIVLLFSCSAFALNGKWRDIEDVKNSPAYWSQDICEKTTRNVCEWAPKPRDVMKGLVNDLFKPMYDKLDAVGCIGEDECMELYFAKDCSMHGDAEPTVNDIFTEVFLCKTKR